MIRTVALTGSTNADLLAELRAGAAPPEGDWLVADRQAQGRGRRGRSWSDGAGNFMGSTIVHPGPADPAAHSLALAAALAMHAATTLWLEKADRPMIKWPNDLLVGDAKLAGCLLEREGRGVVIGIGVNLTNAPSVEGRKTVSLADLGVHAARDSFARHLAACFAAELERWRLYGLDPMLARWQAAAHPHGTQLHVDDPGEGRFAGRFAGLESDGSLRLRLADGSTRVIRAGDVMLA